MKVLIACEESQTVCIEFRKLGIEAYSCDLLECSGGHPEWHLQMDAIKALYSQKWDLVIAHPPCTRLANSGVTWLIKRGLWRELDEAVLFFKEFQKYGENNRIIIENPIPHKYARDGYFYNYHFREGIGKYSQLIQPYQFGHLEQKATCLWVYNLPLLKETNNVKSELDKLPKKVIQRLHYLPPSKDRAKLRSKTYLGIAEAIASQYSKILINKDYDSIK